MTAKDLRARQPYKLDALVAYSGAAYRRAGQNGKHIAAAHGLHRSRGTRYQQGDPGSPLAKALFALSAGDKTTAWPCITEAHALVNQQEICDRPTHELQDRRAELEGLRFDLRRDEDHAVYMGVSTQDVRARLADLYLELLAIERELDERKARGR